MPVTPATGKWAGKHTWFIVDGFNVIAQKLQSLTHKIESIMDRTDGLGDGADESTPVGSTVVTVTQEGGFFDTDAGKTHQAYATKVPTDAQAVQRIATLGFAGTAIGQPFYGYQGLYTGSYEILAEREKLQRANATNVISGTAEQGVILHPLATEVADATTEPASSVDNSADPMATPIPIQSSSVANPTVITTQVPHKLATGETVVIVGHTSTPSLNGEQTVTVLTPTTFTVPVNVTVGGGANGTFTKGLTVAGGTGYLEVTAHDLGTYTGAVVTLRHSADNSVFVDLLAFAAETLTRHAQRVVVAGTINRYLAQSLDRTGAGAGGSITYLTGFARADR